MPKQKIVIIKLADIAMQCSSLFYDEYKSTPVGKRRKYAFSQKLFEEKASKQPQQDGKKQNAFKDFNFDEHIYAFEKDKKQLQRVELKVEKNIKKSHLAILTCNKTCLIQEVLSQIFPPENVAGKYFEEQEHRVIDLFIHKYEEKGFLEVFTRIDCYWIIRRDQTAPFQSILQIYKSMAEFIIEVEGGEGKDFEEEKSRKQVKEELNNKLGRIKQMRKLNVENTY